MDRGVAPRRRATWWLIGGIGLIVAMSGCTTATSELHPGHTELKVTSKGSLGNVISDGDGRTVYLFEADAAHKSRCGGACLSIWPPVTTKGPPTLAGGLDKSKVTLIKLSGGLQQIAYNGHPLYYYQQDTDRDDTYGQDIDQFGAPWYALTAAGNEAETKGKSGGHGGS